MTQPIREAGGLLEATSSAATPTRRNIQIITPGWGSSGYYSPEVLQEAAANKVIPAGTHMYLNHQTATEKNERPERDVEKIAAVLVEDAVWDGVRLFAPADLMGPHAELVESLAPYIGVSITGDATDIVIGEAEGRTGKIIQGLARVGSVDFVTHAGRGGMVLMESARPSLVTARAVTHGVAEATANETREQLQNALRDRFTGDKVYVWVRDFDDKAVWYEHETSDGAGTYELTYTSDDRGVVALSDGDPVEVIAKTTFVPATRPDSTTTTEESEEDPMGKIQIEEAEHQRLTETAGRVDTLEAERDTEKARADAAEQKLAEAVAEAAKAGPRTPRQVLEDRDKDLRHQVATLNARERARSIIAEELAEAWLAPSTIARLSSELIESLPLVEDKLDETALRTRCVERRDQHELEAAEALEAAGVGTPRGLGAQRSSAGADPGKYDETLKESFVAMGLSESAAAIAVKGR